MLSNCFLNKFAVFPFPPNWKCGIYESIYFIFLTMIKVFAFWRDVFMSYFHTTPFEMQAHECCGITIQMFRLLLEARF